MSRVVKLLAVLILIFFTPLSYSAGDGKGSVSTAGELDEPSNLISMDFQDANLKTVLKIFSQQSGLNFVAGQSVEDRTVTIYFDNVSVEDALNYIMKANNLIYEQEPGENIFIVKESGLAGIDTITRIYELRYAQLTSTPGDEKEGAAANEEAEIVGLIKSLLTERGKIVADRRSNSIIIQDVPSQFLIIEDLLTRVDVRTQQVMIEAEILETTTTVADQLGMNWTGTFGVYTGPTANTIWPLRGRFGSNNSSGEGIASTGTVNFMGMGASLSALLSDTDTRILARPKVLTINNETAEIKLTSSTAVASITTTATAAGATATTSTQAERIATGITLKVTPQINKDGYVTMKIEPIVILPVLSRYFTGTGTTSKFVDPQTRSAVTTVRVRDGETIVIGGLISREDTYGFEKVPFLGDIPLLGAAFRYKTTDEVDKELIIFITPHVIKDLVYDVAGELTDREQELPEPKKVKEVHSILDLLQEE